MQDQTPFVSIFTICKNSAYTIRRCIESVLAQDYPNIEYIVQDGASTDGTIEILKEYGDRIKLVSEPDSGAAEGFFRALKRCTGDIIGSCLSDEELLPHAATWAFQNLSKYPEVAAIYGDCYKVDIEGNILSADKGPDPFDFARYLCHEIVPPFCSSFFRRFCLQAIGLKEKEWATDCGEFEFWVRLGIKFPIRHVPGLVSKFGVHPGSNTQKPSTYIGLTQGRIRVMDSFFNDPETPESIRALKPRAIAGMYLWVAETFIGLNAMPEAKVQVQNALQYQPDPKRLTNLISMLCNYGAKLLKDGSAEDALDYFDLATTANLVIPNLNHACAVALAKLGRMDEAIKAAEIELASQPEHAGAKQVLNELLKRTQVTSTKPITRIIKDGRLTEKAPALNEEGEELCKKGDLEGALTIFKKVIEIDPNFAVSHNNLGVLFWQTGETQKALKHFTKALKIDPNDRDTILNCGEVLKSLEKMEDAKRLYSSYLQNNPSDEEISRMLQESGV
ncbi:MAG: tetratricopeptide repeat protein [Desulfobacterales bacterium]|nr:tetratricopeptide repeat protein [Desulfobacterales bacterium]